MRLDNKSIIVTGGSSGFGRESALRMAAEGANLVIADLIEAPASGGVTDDEVSSTAQLINSQGGNAIFVKCDVSQRTDTDTAVAAAIEHFGRLDVMLSNAKTAASRVVFQDPELDRAIAESIPLKRWASSTDIANLAVFLASDEESGFITGDLIKVDGGETLSRYSV